MDGTGKKDDDPVKNGGKPKKPPSRWDDEGFEDGDIATPKRDRVDDEDQPL